uniref:msx2-interacting protein isoform X2 n=1 Tax=Ciona intestinalis TaxID=7719 RepID=UPI000EF557E5|nr:msx2-interacting protein isoform X2 [Ciona intestinalis]|eukprot:XP_026689679.1 msx2-interacting protein isoform X2 [Ciona intestinalis]
MRETRHLWIGNLPPNSREDRIYDYFKRYGRIDKVKFLSKRGSDGNPCAIVAFVDIRSAQKAHNSVNRFDECVLQTNYTMGSAGSRKNDPSPSHHHRSHPTVRTDSRGYDSVERAHSGDRHRPYPQPQDARLELHSDMKMSQKVHRDSRGYDSGSNFSNAKEGRKGSGGKVEKPAKKKLKKSLDEKKQKKTKERGRSPTVKRKSGGKKLTKRSSDDEVGSTSTYSSDSSSASSNSSSATSSRSNSSRTSSSHSSIESDSEGGQKLVTMIIKKLPTRPSVTSLRDGIYHEFKKCGKVKSVVIRGDTSNRHALVLFRNASEAHKGVSHAKSKLLFGAAIEAAIYEGEVSGKELQECGGIIDEFHPRSSRTLFVGNLDKTVGYSDIKNIFVRFGEIVAIEIKKQNNVPQYAFLQYTDIASVVKAIGKMDGERLGKNTLKLGFGKTVMSSCVWVEGVTDSFTEHYLASCFQKHGPVEHVVIDRNRGQALVFYQKYEHAQQALNTMRGRKLNGSRLKLDYASQELIELFLNHMQKSGQSVTTFESIRHLLLPAPSTAGSAPTSTHPVSMRSGGSSSSSHPYSSNDQYFDDPSSSRYPPRGYEPPREGWRSWEDRSRSRPAYQGLSPRGRRYEDDHHDRGEYFHREDDYFPSTGAAYDQDYRNPDYLRREHSREFRGPPLPRGYEDYHRDVKPRERRERDSLHHLRSGHNSPIRVPRRSRSTSPRSSASSGRGRIRDAEGKVDVRLREVSAPRNRSPHRSPCAWEGKGSGSESRPSRKYRGEHRYSPSRHSPPGYRRQTDERRVELREMKSLPSSPRSSVRSKVVQDTSKHSSSNVIQGSQWMNQDSRPSSQHGGGSWSPSSEFNRSRSETPTRDENLGSIGEVIIKQPAVGSNITRTIKQDVVVSNDSEENSTPKTEQGGKKVKSRTTSQTSSVLSEREDLDLHESDLKHEDRKEGKQSKKYKVHTDLHKGSSEHKDSERSVKQTKKLPNLKSHHVTSHSDSDSDPKSKRQKRESVIPIEEKTTRNKQKQLDKTVKHKSVKLIKREYSPSSDVPTMSMNVKDNTIRPRSKSNDLPPLYNEDSSKEYQEIDIKDRVGKNSGNKKRRYSECLKDSDVKHEGGSSYEIKEFSTQSSIDANPDPHSFTKKRSRKTSLKHEAPASIASQSFLEEGDDDLLEDIETKEPSSEFPSKFVVKEEVLEVELSPTPDEGATDKDETTDAEKTPGEDKVSVKRNSSRWEPLTAKPVPSRKVRMAQPFIASLSNPFADDGVSTLTTEVTQIPKHAVSKVSIVQDQPAQPQKGTNNLTELQKEKERLQQLLTKLDTEQLGAAEASQVADVVISEITQKMKKAKMKKIKHEPKQESQSTSLSTDVDVPSSDPHKVDEASVEVITEEIPVDVQPVEEEEQIIVEEVSEEVEVDPKDVSPVADAMPAKEATGLKYEDVDSRQGYRKQMEAKLTQKRKQEQKHLMKKQIKALEKQKRRVERMRGPSQTIVSSMDDDIEDESKNLDDEDDHVDVVHQDDSATSLKHKDLNNEASLMDVETEEEENAVKLNEAPTEEKTLTNVVEKTVPLVKDKQNVNEDNPMLVTKNLPLGVNETTPSQHNEDEGKPDAVDVGSNQIEQPNKSSIIPNVEELIKMKKTPPTVSPFTPKSTSSVGRHSSQRSSSSLNNTPSPTPAKLSKLKPDSRHHPHVKRENSGSSSRHPSSRQHHEKHSTNLKKRVENKAANHGSRNKHKPEPKLLTSLTVGATTCTSEPLSKKELETLRAELETMKNELSLDMSPSFLSQSSDDEANIDKLKMTSPILKSPTLEQANPLNVDKSFGRSTISPSPTTSPATSSLTERLKHLVRVKKKVRLDDSGIDVVKEGEKEERKKIEAQRESNFRSCRLLRSSIFEQDSARLSHLQRNAELFNTVTTAIVEPKPFFSNFIDPNDLVINRPLFNTYNDKTSQNVEANVQTPEPSQTTIQEASLAKNAFSLSSEPVVPASAGSSLETFAGNAVSYVAANLTTNDDVQHLQPNLASISGTLDTVAKGESASIEKEKPEPNLPHADHAEDCSLHPEDKSLVPEDKSLNVAEIIPVLDVDHEEQNEIKTMQNIVDDQDQTREVVEENIKKDETKEVVPDARDEESLSKDVSDLLPMTDESKTEQLDMVEPSLQVTEISSVSIDQPNVVDVANVEVPTSKEEEIVQTDADSTNQPPGILETNLVKSKSEDEVQDQPFVKLVEEDEKIISQNPHEIEDVVIENNNIISTEVVTSDDLHQASDTNVIDMEISSTIDEDLSQEVVVTVSTVKEDPKVEAAEVKAIQVKDESSWDSVDTKVPVEKVEIKGVEHQSKAVEHEASLESPICQTQIKTVPSKIKSSVKKVDSSFKTSIDKSEKKMKDKMLGDKDKKHKKLKKIPKKVHKDSKSDVKTHQPDKESDKNVEKKFSEKNILKTDKMKSLSDSAKLTKHEGKAVEKNLKLETTVTADEASKTIKTGTDGKSSKASNVVETKVEKVKSEIKQSQLQKPLLSEKKGKSKLLSSDKKKILDLKQKSDIKSQSSQKKRDDGRVDKEKKSSKSFSKTHSDVKKVDESNIKQDKHESKSESHHVRSDDKVKLKSKHFKSSYDNDQPAKKKAKVESSSKKEVPKKQKSRGLSYSSDENSELAQRSKQEAKPTKQRLEKRVSSFLQDTVERAMENPSQAPTWSSNVERKQKAERTRVEGKIGMRYSEDSDSSDNYDSFISQMSGGKSDATKQRNEQHKSGHIYTSSEDSSDDSDSSADVKPTVVKQPVHTTDKSKHQKKAVIKPQKEQSKVVKKLKKGPDTHSKATVVKKGSSSKSELKKKMKPKEGKILKKPKQEIESSEFSTSEDERPTVKSKKVKSKSEASLDHSEGSKTVDKPSKPSPNHGHSAKFSSEVTKTKDEFREKSDNKRRYSSSSVDSLDYPRPLSSSYLTTETIKDETLLPPDYMSKLPSLNDPEKRGKSEQSLKYGDAIKKQHKEAPIYTSSSSSDSELDGYQPSKSEPNQLVNKEERSLLLGNSSSDSDMDDDIFMKIAGDVLKEQHPSSENKPQKTEHHKITHSVKEDTHSNKPSPKQPHLDTTSFSKSSVKSETIKDSNTPKSSDKIDSMKSKPTSSDSKHLTSSSEHKVDKKIKSGQKSKSIESSCKDVSRSDDKKHTKSSHDKSTDKYTKSKHGDKLKASGDGKKSQGFKHEKIIKQSSKDIGQKTNKLKMSQDEKVKDSGSPRRIKHEGEQPKLSSSTPKLKQHSKSKEAVKDDQQGHDSHADNSDKGGKISSKHPKQPHDQPPAGKPHKRRESEKHKKHDRFPKSATSKPEPQRSFKSEKFTSKTTLHKQNSSKTILHEKKKETVAQNPQEVSDSDFAMPGMSFFRSDSSGDDEVKKSSSSKTLHPADAKQREERKQSPQVFVKPSNKVPQSPSKKQPPFYSPSHSYEKSHESEKPSSTKSHEQLLTKDDGDEDKLMIDLDQDLGAATSKTDKSVASSNSEPEEPKKKFKSHDLKSESVPKQKMDPLYRRSSTESSDKSPRHRMSSFEQYQSDHERRLETLEHLKLSRQRDEEAVRSIMGDEGSGYLSASSCEVDFFGNPVKSVKEIPPPDPMLEILPSQFSPEKSPVKRFAEEEENNLKSSKTLFSAESDTSSSKEENKPAKDVSLEPRSTAEEIELAAAVSSIEFGFGDFGGNQSTETTTKKSSFENTYEDKEEEKASSEVNRSLLDVGNNEAAMAASALLMESNTDFYKPVAPEPSMVDAKKSEQKPSPRKSSVQSSKNSTGSSAKREKRPPHATKISSPLKGKSEEKKHAEIPVHGKESKHDAAKQPDDECNLILPSITGWSSPSPARDREEHPPASKKKPRVSKSKNVLKREHKDKNVEVGLATLKPPPQNMEPSVVETVSTTSSPARPFIRSPSALLHNTADVKIPTTPDNKPEKLLINQPKHTSAVISLNITSTTTTTTSATTIHTPRPFVAISTNNTQYGESNISTIIFPVLQ